MDCAQRRSPLSQFLAPSHSRSDGVHPRNSGVCWVMGKVIPMGPPSSPFPYPLSCGFNLPAYSLLVGISVSIIEQRRLFLFLENFCEQNSFVSPTDLRAIDGASPLT